MKHLDASRRIDALEKRFKDLTTDFSKELNELKSELEPRKKTISKKSKKK